MTSDLLNGPIQNELKTAFIRKQCRVSGQPNFLESSTEHSVIRRNRRYQAAMKAKDGIHLCNETEL